MIATRIIRRAGMSLIELMVALAISAALLTATAVALDASIKAYQINQQQATLLQQTRLAMNRVLSTIRRCKLHAPETSLIRSQFATGKTVTDTGISMLDESGTEIIYSFDAANQRVVASAGGSSHPLVEGVVDFTVTLEPLRSATSVKTGGGWDLLKRATILMTVQSNERTSLTGEGSVQKVKISLSASVMPRRNTW